MNNDNLSITEPDEKKPPIGITPEFIWKEDRARELARAIVRYLEYEGFSSTVQKWSSELRDLCEEWYRKNPNIPPIQLYAEE